MEIMHLVSRAPGIHPETATKHARHVTNHRPHPFPHCNLGPARTLGPQPETTRARDHARTQPDPSFVTWGARGVTVPYGFPGPLPMGRTFPGYTGGNVRTVPGLTGNPP